MITYAINFLPKFKANILKGWKCGTVRLGEKPYKLGPVTLNFQDGTCADAYVHYLAIKEFRKLDQLDAVSDGYRHPGELKKALKEIYGEIQPQQRVTVVRFDVSAKVGS